MGCVSVPKQGEGGDSARVKVWRGPVSRGLCRAGHSRAEVTYRPEWLPCDTPEAGVANTEGARAGMSPWVWAGTAGMGGGSLGFALSGEVRGDTRTSLTVHKRATSRPSTGFQEPELGESVGSGLHQAWEERTGEPQREALRVGERGATTEAN